MGTVRTGLWCILVFLSLNTALSAQPAMQFVPVSPCRLLDTRQANGPIPGGTFQSFNLALLAQSVGCQNLSNAAAFSLNVTVVPRGYLGYITVWPAGQPRPVISLMNSLDGRVKADAAIVLAGTNHSVSIYVTNTADVVLDVNGFFEPATYAAFAYYPLATPCRVADTRYSQPLQAGQEHDFPILTSGCGIPNNAQAYSLNFTAIPTGSSLGFLTVWPAGLPRPTASTLNDPTGTIVANAALIPASGTNGEVAVYSSDNTNLVIDIGGYFALATPSGGYAFYALTPCRAVDTRLTGGAFTLQKTFDIQGSSCHPPNTATSYALNATVLPVGSLGYLTLWPGGARPLASTLNAIDGAYTSNLAIVGNNLGSISAYANGTTNLLLDLSGYMASLPSLSIGTSSLPAGTTGQPYNTQLAGTGGEPPYSWSITNGLLPDGLTMSIDGRIIGIPTATGSFPITFKVSDQFANSTTRDLSINVVQGNVVITSVRLPNGVQSVSYSAALAAAGGTAPYSWSIIDGALPDGLTLNTDSGLISGVPTTAGTSQFTVQVQDSQSIQSQKQLQIVVSTPAGLASLNGHYAFSFNGFNNGHPVLMAGSFVADGNGHLNPGVVDVNTGQGEQAGGYTFTGTYAIGANGMGTMTFTNVGAYGNLAFFISVANAGNGQMIQQNQDPNTRGSGSFLVQQPTGLPPAVGTYVMASSGADASFNRYAEAGAFSVPALGTVSNGVEDANDNGGMSSRSFTGTFFPSSPQTGRGQALLNFSGGVTGNYAYYVVSSGQYFLIATDTLSAQHPLTVGTVQVQLAATFNNAALNGNSVLQLSGLNPNGGSPVTDVILGIANWDAGGAGTTTLDENRGGTIIQQSVLQGRYNVAQNGRVTTSNLGAGSPLMYLFNFNQGFVLGRDSTVFSGVLEPQNAPPPYRNQSIVGTYQGGTINPVESAIIDAISYFQADGNGHINGDQQSCGISGCSENPALSAGFQTDPSGRAVVTGNLAGFLYLVSPKKMVLLPDGSTPVLSTFSSSVTQ